MSDCGMNEDGEGDRKKERVKAEGSPTGGEEWLKEEEEAKDRVLE